jgi:hypothetical protein
MEVSLYAEWYGCMLEYLQACSYTVYSAMADVVEQLQLPV